jgi:hypothetical protein
LKRQVILLAWWRLDTLLVFYRMSRTQVSGPDQSAYRSNSSSRIAQQNTVRVLSPLEKAWLAGVIDGEGSIYISEAKAEYSKRGLVYHAYLSVANSNHDFVAKVREVIGWVMSELRRRKGSIGKMGANTRVRRLSLEVSCHR